MSDKRTDRIAQLRIDLYNAERERDELMAANVLLSQENELLLIALKVISNVPSYYLTACEKRMKTIAKEALKVKE